MGAPSKVPLPLAKAKWHPSPLPGQVVLVSTVDAEGAPNLAPKSWTTMVAAGDPIFGFGCSTEHATFRNAEATGEFVVNVPPEALADRVWELIRRHGADRIAHSGLTLLPAQTVAPPLIAECRAHLECRLDDVKRYGREVFLFGRIVAASIDADCLEGGLAERYFRLRPFFFLEDGTYGSLDGALRVGAAEPTEHRLFLVEVGRPPGTAPDGHAAFLRGLRGEGRLLLAGPLADGDGAAPADVYVVRAGSAAEAEALAGEDPLVRAGAAVSVRAWTRTF